MKKKRKELIAVLAVKQMSLVNGNWEKVRAKGIASVK